MTWSNTYAKIGSFAIFSGNWTNSIVLLQFTRGPDPPPPLPLDLRKKVITEILLAKIACNRNIANKFVNKKRLIYIVLKVDANKA